MHGSFLCVAVAGTQHLHHHLNIAPLAACGDLIGRVATLGCKPLLENRLGGSLQSLFADEHRLVCGVALLGHHGGGHLVDGGIPAKLGS